MQAPLDPTILEGLYATEHASQKWQPILDQLHPIVNAKSAGLIVIENRLEGGDRHHFGATSRGVDPQQLQTYNERYAHYDQSMLEVSKFSEPGTMLVDPSFEDIELISQRPDVAFAIEHLGVRDRFGVKLNDDPAWQDAIAFQYDVSRRGATQQEFSRLQPYLPHIAQAVSLGRIYDQIRQKYNAVLAMLDRVAVGMLLLRSDSTVIICNRYARRVIDDSACIEITSSQKLQATGTQQAELRHSIKEIANRSSLSTGLQKLHLPLTDALEDEKLLIELSPLIDQNAEVERNFAGTLAIIIDPNSPISFDESALGALYALTPAEVEVASLIGSGHNNPEIAEVRSTSKETTKKQVGSIFSKMKTNSRAGVLRRLMAIKVPFDW